MGGARKGQAKKSNSNKKNFKVFFKEFLGSRGYDCNRIATLRSVPGRGPYILLTDHSHGIKDLLVEKKLLSPFIFFILLNGSYPCNMSYSTLNPTLYHVPTQKSKTSNLQSSNLLVLKRIVVTLKV